jgi:enoyl-[acyl-carrier-protein] reductase (NADH)
MLPGLRHALTATMDITRTRALPTDITGLAGLTAAFLSELVRGSAGDVGIVDSGADVRALADDPASEAGLVLGDGLVSEVER